MKLEDIPQWTAYSSYPSTEALNWCHKTFEDGSWWYEGQGYFGFDNEQHYVMFLLKWD